MTYNVDRKIPMPKRGSTRKGKSKYPWATMKVGDSFAVAAVNAGAVLGAAYHNTKLTGQKYSMRKMDNGSYRCWRVK